MKNRIIAFTLIWAYVCFALWLPQAAPDSSPLLYFSPPGYFFLLGFFLALLNEPLAGRWSRLWVTTAVAAVAVEVGAFFYSGHYPGIWLGLLLALATLITSISVRCLTRYLAQFSLVLTCGAILGCLLGLCWLTMPFTDAGAPKETTLSPDGRFQVWVLKNEHSEIQSVHIGPCNGWNGAFGRALLSAGVKDLGEDQYEVVKLENAFWQDTRRLSIRGSFSEELPRTSFLLPISTQAIQTQ